ncbi:MAG: hypothetical protein ACRDPK_10320 [Carbonactinosporaceae bacterium]
MSDAVKIGTALAGGYLLGRTKKVKLAIGVGLWAAGKGRPRDMLRHGVVHLAQSPEGAKLLQQVRGGLLESVRGAATSAFNAQLGSLADDLNRRTALRTAQAESMESQEEAEGGEGRHEATNTVEKEPDTRGETARQVPAQSSPTQSRIKSPRKPSRPTGRRSTDMRPGGTTAAPPSSGGSSGSRSR